MHNSFGSISTYSENAECSGVPRRGLGGLEPLPLAYGLRNKRVRMRQNMGTAPSPCPSLSGEGEGIPPSREGIPPPHVPPPRSL